MSILPGKPFTHRPKGLVDAIDGSNAPEGSMSSLQNLIPSLTTLRQWIPRPAWTGLAGGGGAVWGSFAWGAGVWGGFGNIAAAAQINALLVVGNYIYGMVAVTSGTNAGKDQPFVYNWATQTFLTISIPGGAASLPTTPASSGDWTPPTMSQVAQRIIVTHPGFTGGTSPFFGWIDVSGFSDNSHTGTTHSTTTIDGLSANVLTAGWQVGMTITGSGIPANTTISSIAANGLSIVMSRAATASAGGVTLAVAGGTTTAPLWASGNTNGTVLTAVPVAVLQFNGRAYYAVSTGVQFSDSALPCQITNATQAIVFQNGLSVTALGGLPYFQTTGGLLQALIAFQGDSQMQQITGDAATSNLAVNAIGIGVGTIAPLTICQTPLGLTFVSPDGVRFIDPLGRISDPIGYKGDGVINPFLNAVSPSRMCAAYNQDVFRVTVQNAAISGSPYQEYWLHVSKKVWSGPHTCACSLVQPLQASPHTTDFVIVPQGTTALLSISNVQPSSSSTYTENGNPLSWTFQTTLLPDTEQMAENAVVETTTALALPSQTNVTVLAVNETGNTLNMSQITGAAITGATWGSSTWGAFVWQAASGSLRQYDIPWTAPLVFKQMTLIYSGFSVASFAIGNVYMKYRPLGYRLQAMAAVSGGAV